MSKRIPKPYREPFPLLAWLLLNPIVWAVIFAVLFFLTKDWGI